MTNIDIFYTFLSNFVRKWHFCYFVQKRQNHCSEKIFFKSHVGQWICLFLHKAAKMLFPHEISQKCRKYIGWFTIFQNFLSDLLFFRIFLSDLQKCRKYVEKCSSPKFFRIFKWFTIFSIFLIDHKHMNSGAKTPPPGIECIQDEKLSRYLAFILDLSKEISYKNLHFHLTKVGFSWWKSD